MGLLDNLGLGDMLKSLLGQGESTALPALINAVLAKTQYHDLNGLVAALQNGGLDAQVKSWLGPGANLPITEELSARSLRLPFFNEITEDEQARTERHLSNTQSGEYKLGILHNLEVRRLLALGERYQRIEDAQLHIKTYTGRTAEEEETAHREAHRAHYLYKICWELFWLQSSFQQQKKP